MQKRIELKALRIRHDMSQQEMANILGVNRSTYAMIERGQRRGNDAVWAALKEKFNIPDAEMWKLMQKGS